VEYGELRSGVRAESFIFGLGQFVVKAALGIAAGIFGYALDSVGFVPNTDQSAETLEGMKVIMVALPLAGVLGGIIAMRWYPLRKGDHERIVEQLANRGSTPYEAG